jgi:hypothetical protein
MRWLAASLLLLLHASASPVAVAQDRRPPRRQPVTPELERTAFADARARTLLERARAARLAQDSALRAYDARTYQRVSVGIGFRRIGRDRLLLRTEQAARVRWARGSSVLVEPTGRRTAFPMGRADMDLTAGTPIPYFPGRESLWPLDVMSGAARVEVDENHLIHPLARGAEAYYRYATGDSISLRLPDGRVIALRELRITARRPEWRAFVGSFWFDVDRGNLVRAAYRMAADIDIWQEAEEDQRREAEERERRARADTGAVAERARRRAERHRDDGPPVWVKGMLSPMRAKISAITVEYGLHQGRFWLPKRHVAEGEAQAGFVRVPVTFEETFRYNSVNASDAASRVPTLAEAGLADDDTTWAASGDVVINVPTPGDNRRRADTSAAARADSLLGRYAFRADSLRTAAEQARAKGDTAAAQGHAAAAQWYRGRVRQITRRREACARGDSAHYYAGAVSRQEGALRMIIRMPCDTSQLATSPDLPRSIYEPGEEIFGAAERDELLESLDFSLQPEWAPQKPVLHTGLDLLRYNRVEGLSVGGSATSVLGKGYTAQAVGRIGTGDWVPNADLSISRSNGRAELRLGVFHRLGVANDDWGAPLSFGASVANLLYARDEGFYYRTWGAEFAGTRDAPGVLGGATLLWRVFAERQRSAGREPNTQASLGNAVGDTRFERNIDAAQLTALGAGGELARTFGADPTGLRLHTRLRAEAAFTDRSDSVGTSGYGRFVVDGTLSRGLGRFAAAVTGAAGTSAGDLPAQRAFYVGGLHTVRGQFARPEGAGRVGDTFWLARAELGLGNLAARPAIFYDAGWAGPRADFARPGRPLSGAGAGMSFLDGLLRIDVARGIWPEKRWRTDLYLEARF